MTSAVERTIGGSGIFLSRRFPRGAGSADELRVQLLRRGDGVVALTAVIVALFAFPARLAFRSLGGVGNPALLLGMALFVWYVALRLVPWQRPPREGFAARFLLSLFGLSVLASYVAGMTRPISGEEVRAADRGILLIVAALGIALIAIDGTPDRGRLDTLLARLATGGAVEALIGLLQYYGDFDVTRYVRFPGLTTGGAQLDLIGDRDGLRRVAGTASHPIEFGVVLGVILPVALHYAVYARPGARWGPWLKVALIAAALPLSLSRSAIIAVAVSLIMLMPTWPRRRRRAALAVIPLGVVAVRLTSPGVVGTIISLFANITHDDSTTGRTDDYTVAGHFIAESPIFGRGFGTFIPDKYRILDNAYLGHTIETGFVGLSILLLLFVGSVRVARVTARRATDPVTRDLARTLAAAIASAAVAFVTFDALGYAMVLTVVFLLIGCAGALARHEELRRTELAAANPGPPLPRPPHPGFWDLGRLGVRRWYVTVPLVTVGLLWARSAYHAPGTYEASAELAIMTKPTGQGNPYTTFNLASQTVAQVVAQREASRDIVVNLADSGVKAQYVVSAEHLGTDENPAPAPAPSVLITAWSSDPAAALTEMQELVASVGADLAGVQNSAAPAYAARLQTVPTSLPARASHVTASRSRALVSVLLVTSLLLLFLHCLLEQAMAGLRRVGAAVS